MRVRVCVRACLRACVCVRACVCERVCVCADQCHVCIDGLNSLHLLCLLQIKFDIIITYSFTWNSYLFIHAERCHAGLGQVGTRIVFVRLVEDGVVGRQPITKPQQLAGTVKGVATQVQVSETSLSLAVEGVFADDGYSAVAYVQDLSLIHI